EAKVTTLPQLRGSGSAEEISQTGEETEDVEAGKAIEEGPDEVKLEDKGTKSGDDAVVAQGNKDTWEVAMESEANPASEDVGKESKSSTVDEGISNSIYICLDAVSEKRIDSANKDKQMV
ncbi:hypothetical protein U1Q18_049237, partial [Sarracenia purpurea var. burkii]